MNLALYPHLLAIHDGARPAVEQGNLILDYRNFENLSRRIAWRLRRAGLGRGDVCGVMLRDDSLHLAAMFAVWRLGAVMLAMDWRLPVAEAAGLTMRLRPALVVATREIALPGAGRVVTLDGIEGEADAELPVEPADDEAAIHALSSGTTGEPRVAVITHRQQEARILAYTAGYGLMRDDRYLSTVPLAYSWGRNMAVTYLCLGATIILHPTIFAPEELPRAVATARVTTAAIAPKVSRELLRLPSAGGRLLEPLRLYLSSTAPLYAEERRGIRERVAANLVEAYGTTETAVITVLSPADQLRAPGSVGRPVPGVAIEIVDEAGRPLPVGEIGRLCCRGPGFASGYLAASQDDGQRFRDGWFYPGDLGRVDAEGFLHLEGRNVDIIKRGGLSIYASEVERVLRIHRAVSEAAVVGVPAGDLGEEVVAFVTLHEPIDAAELARHCRVALAAFKQPREIRILDAMPRNAGGKVVKAALLDRLQ
jgi:acyl-CoA synthetase (AMP-forming)/AMP-acid ligase II